MHMPSAHRRSPSARSHSNPRNHEIHLGCALGLTANRKRLKQQNVVLEIGLTETWIEDNEILTTVQPALATSV